MQHSLKKKNIIYLKFLHDFFNQNKTLQEWNSMLEFHILKEYSLGIYGKVCNYISQSFGGR